MLHLNNCYHCTTSDWPNLESMLCRKLFFVKTYTFTMHPIIYIFMIDMFTNFDLFWVLHVAMKANNCFFRFERHSAQSQRKLQPRMSRNIETDLLVFLDIPENNSKPKCRTGYRCQENKKYSTTLLKWLKKLVFSKTQKDGGFSTTDTTYINFLLKMKQT